ncbi:alpha/beta fold hydrolase [Corynebacterium sp.]|uniref:alpha/beta fold hydrolase n=1 Tax=Corynebacterium sp. TaxID=1720 RepID=UPI0026DF572D|nr:alpha/beta hydrolase [Corynebacterium sp.]MDO5511681.1 alpha/beta hydrolase [Corynebacterium sp.]
MTDLVLVPTAGRMPDTWTEVIRALPAGWKPWLPNLAVTSLEQYLDKQELRRVVLVGHGTGALAALEVARAQPHRVSHLVLAQRPDARALRILPGFLLRRRGVDKQALLDPVDVAMPTLLIDVTYERDPSAFVAEITSFLAAHPA